MCTRSPVSFMIFKWFSNHYLSNSSCVWRDRFRERSWAQQLVNSGLIVTVPPRWLKLMEVAFTGTGLVNLCNIDVVRPPHSPSRLMSLAATRDEVIWQPCSDYRALSTIVRFDSNPKQYIHHIMALHLCTTDFYKTDLVRINYQMPHPHRGRPENSFRHALLSVWLYTPEFGLRNGSDTLQGLFNSIPEKLGFVYVCRG